MCIYRETFIDLDYDNTHAGYASAGWRLGGLEDWKAGWLGGFLICLTRIYDLVEFVIRVQLFGVDLTEG